MSLNGQPKQPSAASHTAELFEAPCPCDEHDVRGATRIARIGREVPRNVVSSATTPTASAAVWRDASVEFVVKHPKRCFHASCRQLGLTISALLRLFPPSDRRNVYSRPDSGLGLTRLRLSFR